MDCQNKWVGLNVYTSKYFWQNQKWQYWYQYWGGLCFIGTDYSPNGVDWGRLTVCNKYLKIFFFCRVTIAEYLSYEETAAFIEATKWKGYKFLSSEDVYNNIVAIPNELHGEEPEEQLKEQESETVAATTKEISKASSVAKILNLVDNQKAAAIKDYVRNKFGRQLVRTDSEDQNCFFPVSAHAIGEQGING